MVRDGKPNLNSAMAKTTDSEFSSPAPYGQACIDCSRAKCKCMRRPAGGSCQRCLRRGTECRLPTSVRQKGIQALGSQTASTARLEKKLDTLVSLLQPAPGAAASSGVSRPNDDLGIQTSFAATPSSTGVADERSNFAELVWNIPRCLTPGP